MRVLILGGGGREHALARGIAASSRVDRVICAPGNAGTASLGDNVSVDLSDNDAVVALARDRCVDLTIVGPEDPLCNGIVDRFLAEGLRIFGPTAAAARIEGDKSYAKNLMKNAGIPTAKGRSFDHYNEARDYIASRESGVVVKASGLAAGKGVFVCEEPSDALIALEQIMLDKAFGDAGLSVVVEELLKGEELSVFALVDGRTIYVLDTAGDHKRLGDGDAGPNTGGMGAYSPSPFGTSELLAKVESEVLVPVVDAMRRDGAPYRGVLYVGLMITPGGPKVLEFNCRFGDPETQPLLMRLESDLVDVLEAVVDGRLDQIEIRWNPKPAVCVVMASAGYPGSYEKGKTIEGLDSAGAMDDVFVYHAGTTLLEKEPVSNGGRVLGVTALGANMTDARDRAYEATSKIGFEGAFRRSDIAARVIHAETS